MKTSTAQMIEQAAAEERFETWDQHRRLYNAMQLTQAFATRSLLLSERDLQELAKKFPQFS